MLLIESKAVVWIENLVVKIIRHNIMMPEDDGREMQRGDKKGKDGGGSYLCVAEPSCFEIASINLAPVYGQQYINKKRRPDGGTPDLQMWGEWLLTRLWKQ